MRKSHTHYVEWILQFIAITGYDSYLELGVWIGTVFDRVPLTNKMGVRTVN
jgi:hypothetical protein